MTSQDIKKKERKKERERERKEGREGGREEGRKEERRKERERERKKERKEGRKERRKEERKERRKKERKKGREGGREEGKPITGTSLAVQWLGLRASTAGGTGSIPGPGTKIPHAMQKKKRERENLSLPPSTLFHKRKGILTHKKGGQSEN